MMPDSPEKQNIVSRKSGKAVSRIVVVPEDIIYPSPGAKALKALKRHTQAQVKRAIKKIKPSYSAKQKSRGQIQP